jgi:predicted nucleic acid-binding protein
MSRRDFPALFTTEAVLTEVANSLSRVPWRSLALDLVEEVRRDPRFTIVNVSTILFNEALDLYASRTDKEWSLTDCISFVVMTQQRLTHALAIDKDCAQAGFQLPTAGHSGPKLQWSDPQTCQARRPDPSCVAVSPLSFLRLWYRPSG